MTCAILAGVAATTALACTLVPTPTGLLGNGTFTYVCPTDSTSAPDLACPTSNGWPTHPVAVGASFTVTYAQLSTNGGEVEGSSIYAVTPASPLLASPSDGGLIAKGAGYEALLAYSGDVVDDFVFVRFEAIDHLVPSSNSVTLVDDSLQTLSVQPTDVAGNTLGGQLACNWSITAGSAVVMFASAPESSSVQIQATSNGTATLHAVCGGSAVDVTVNVLGVPGGSDGGSHE